ncbi:SDR family NAD(P)-dependent oxidoreductase [Sphingobium sp. R-7]|uniref:SDR family NAD(P)-dependent oxidoreductase n=1 Tax=Sphingobium sp. R-7 TaxID=3375449 RepID=UPI00398B2C5B
MDLELRGRRALVTGSTSGIGEGIARTLTAEGAAVIIHGRSLDRAKALREAVVSAGGRCEIVLGDLSSPQEVERVAQEATEAFGGIDILINNSGGMVSQAGAQSWFGAPLSDWMHSYQSNVIAAVHLIHLLTPGMRERGWGRIVQIGSVVATDPAESTADYAASKAAMVNLTLSLSKALSRTGITVNAISPGMIQTPAIDSWLRSIGEEHGWGDDEARSIEVALGIYPQSVARLGQPHDIGSMAAFLCSTAADFITGSNMHVDGGVTANMG